MTMAKASRGTVPIARVLDLLLVCATCDHRAIRRKGMEKNKCQRNTALYKLQPNVASLGGNRVGAGRPSNTPQWQVATKNKAHPHHCRITGP